MANVSREVLVGFVEEAQSYLPEIRDGVSSYRADTTDTDGLERAYRHAHTIKGAAAMIGESALSHIAFYLEETLEDVAGNQIALDDNTINYVRKAVNQLELYLRGLFDGNVRDQALLTEATRAYRTLRGLPVDDSSVEQAIAEVEKLTHDDDLDSLGALDDGPSGDSPLPTISFDDEFMEELREAFAEEARDHLDSIARLLNHLNKAPEDHEQLRELRRIVHTLKGASATVGLSEMAKVSHRMEDLLDHLADAGRDVSRPVMNLLFDSADVLEDQAADTVDVARLNALLKRYDNLSPTDDSAEATRAAAAAANISTAPTPAPKTDEPVEILQFESVMPATPAPSKHSSDEPAKPTPKAAPARAAGEVVRVPLERLDELVRLTSEFVISRTTLEQRINALNNLVNELAPSLERLQRLASRLDSDYHDLNVASQNMQPGNDGSQLAMPSSSPVADKNGFNQGDFDVLEFDRYTELYMLGRELTETTSDIRTVHSELRTLLGDFDSVLTRQGRLSSEVQDKLMRTRMVPLANVTSRLQRAVRLVAQKQSKQVDLIIEGEQIELDKKVLEEMADPLLHILRNAVDHGIEPSELRQVVGKPEQGTIRVRAYYEGNQVVLEVRDDGAGIDANRLRARAIRSGYLSEADSADVSDFDLYQLIFLPGFSTAEQVSDVSGRGVGMDVVRASVNELKGTIQLDTTLGKGTTFTIRLPLTLAVMRGLLVRAARQTFTLPLGQVSQILRLEEEQIEQVGRNPVIRVGDQLCHVRQLSSLLGLPASDLSERKRIPVLIVNAGDQRFALVVDEIIEGREIVIKTLGNHLRQVHGVTGATLMGDGTVVLILNPAELVIDPDRLRATRQWTPPASAISAPARRTLDILVVDDSVSVRKVVSNMVKNAGWNAIQARDGLEALEAIQTRKHLPDALLLDIEMPRMNGYELTATLRANEAWRNIPIIMLTSRAGDKHRNKAFELGVNEYLIKPYREEQLLGAVRTLTGVTT